MKAICSSGKFVCTLFTRPEKKLSMHLKAKVHIGGKACNGLHFIERIILIGPKLNFQLLLFTRSAANQNITQAFFLIHRRAPLGEKKLSSAKYR